MEIKKDLTYGLLKKHTNLTEDDINIITDFSKCLPIVAEAQGCDVFIDCSTNKPNLAVVVAEYRPENSLYNKDVVGKYAERKNEPAVFRTLETTTPSQGLKGLNQENKAIIQNVSAIKNKKRKVIGVFIMERDETDILNKEFLSEPKKIKGNTFESREELSITKYLDDGIVYFNNEATVIYANQKATTLFLELGYRETLFGMRFQNLVLGEVRFSEILKKNYVEIQNLSVAQKMLEIKYYTINNNTVNFGVAMIIKDLTDIHNIKRELVFKTTGIKEIHHRVKNNLQTIASLLRLQARRLEDSPEKKILTENINRIISISLTHEILAKSGEDDVNIKGVIEKLVTYISRASLPTNSQIQCVVTGEDVLLKSEVATSVALVINELVQNSFEHAFKESLGGKVVVDISKKNKTAIITVTDNGAGFNTDKTSKDSLGLVIVRSMVTEKLGGKLSIDSDQSGTKVKINFLII